MPTGACSTRACKELGIHARSTWFDEGQTREQYDANGQVLGRYGVGIDPVNPRDDNGRPPQARYSPPPCTRHSSG